MCVLERQREILRESNREIVNDKRERESYSALETHCIGYLGVQYPVVVDSRWTVTGEKILFTKLGQSGVRQS